MKKTRLQYRIILLIACVLFLTQSTYAQDAKTEAKVEFTEGQGPTKPVIPDEPGTETDVDPVEGSLAIVHVSDFNFGTIPVMSTTQLFDIQTDTPNIQVVDLRGTGVGWRVSANVSRFSDGENQSLPGAAIFIYNGRPISLSSSSAPVQRNVKLTTDGATALVLSAAAGAGTGLWVMRWYPLPPPETEEAYIQLEIPAGSATVGSHTAEVNWILENTPAT